MRMTFCGAMSLRLIGLFAVGGVVACLGAAEQAGRDDSSPGRQGAFAVEVRPLVAGPSDASQWEAWREGLYAERRRMRERLGYDGET